MTIAPGLVRSLRGRGVVLLTLSALSPTASVFVTGSNILHLAGTGAAAAVLVGGSVILLAALLAAELAAAFPSAGGIYPGVAAVLGPGAGFTVATLGLITTPVLLGFLALGFATYVRVLAPAVAPGPVAIAALAVAMALAVMRVRTDALITGIVLVAELLALLLVVVVAAMTPARSLGAAIAHPVMIASGGLVPVPSWTMMLAMVAGAFACSGATAATFFAEDLLGQPSRIGRIVLASALLSLGAICIPIVMIVTSAHDLTDILSADAPIARYLTITIGPAAARAATFVVAAAILNNIVAFMVASSRMFFAAARDGLWPAPIAVRLARVHRRFGSPWIAAIAIGSAAIGFTFVDPHHLLIVLSGEVFTGLLLVVAVTVGRLRGVTGVTTFRAPLFPLTPIAGAIAVTAFLTADWHDPATGRPSVILLAGIALAAFLFDRVRRRRMRGG